MSAPIGMVGSVALAAVRPLAEPAARDISSPFVLKRISPDGSKRRYWPRFTLNPVLVHCTFPGTTTVRALAGAAVRASRLPRPRPRMRPGVSGSRSFDAIEGLLGVGQPATLLIEPR